jgi:hypothetical protein
VAATDGIPDIAHVERVAALGDAVVRNLQITECYSRLSAALGRRTGPGANWCTFAAWASKQAGQTIRGEDLSRTLQHALADILTTSQAGEVVRALDALTRAPDLAGVRRSLEQALGLEAAARQASEAVARGNLKVFAEIGREFARFLAELAPDTAFDAAHLERFCAGLRPGEPPAGQELLRQAFTHCYGSFFETDPEACAELRHMANVEIGLHEQIRLQPEILAALNAPIAEPDVVVARLLSLLFPWRGLVPRLLRFLQRLFRGPTPLDLAVRDLVAQARPRLRAVLTDQVMTLELPRGQQLRLGDDLHARFPQVLTGIGNAELRALLERVDRTPDSVQGTGAKDWGELPQRMHFIADLFRCYYAAPELFDPPFSPEQVAVIEAGGRPGGRL